MSVVIKCPELWTYKSGVVFEGAIADYKVPLSYLNKHEYTHIHGELQIIIDGRIIPHLGHFKDNDVCIGNWVIWLTTMIGKFNSSNIRSYTIEGDDQGKPNYIFDKEEDTIYFSIVDSPLGGEKDHNWQKVEFGYNEFITALDNFKKSLLLEMSKHAPDMVSYWNEAFISAQDIRI